jgi:polyhydroxyalkanoate synthase
VVSLLTDALSPTNTLLGNPAAQKRVIDSGGANLLEGVKNPLPDLTANQETPAQVDRIAFELRNDLALSQGAIVFRNSVLELIQYAPATGGNLCETADHRASADQQVLHLRSVTGEEQVEYLVKNGFRVFVVNWATRPRRKATGTWTPMLQRCLPLSQRGNQRSAFGTEETID